MKRLTPKQQAKFAEKKILKDNEGFYNDIVKSHFSEKKSHTKRIAILGSSAASVILTVVLCLVFLLPSNLGPGIVDPPKKHYLLENEVSVPSDIEELNLNLSGVIINLTSRYDFKIQRTYDSESNDNLFFLISIAGEDTFETVKIYVYINPDYEHKKQTIEEPIKTKNIGGFDVEYKESITKDSDEIFTFIYVAKTAHENLAIYLEYEQLWFKEETNFFNFFEETIKLS